MKHICGVCKKEFETEDQYLEHTCEVTSFTPQDPEHFINSTTPNYADISEGALARGNTRKELEDRGLSAAEAVKATAHILNQQHADNFMAEVDKQTKK